ncbi:MAG: hypothetical protein ACRDG3_09200 [Tepidiformaceae bacterium]
MPAPGGAVGAAGGFEREVADGPGPVCGAAGVGEAAGSVGVCDGRPAPVTPMALGLAIPGVGLGVGVSEGVATAAPNVCFVPAEASLGVAAGEDAADAASGAAPVPLEGELLERRSKAKTVAKAATARPVATCAANNGSRDGRAAGALSGTVLATISGVSRNDRGAGISGSARRTVFTPRMSSKRLEQRAHEAR